MANPAKRIGEEKRGEMISSYLAGEPVAPLAQRHGVPRSTLYAVLRAAGIEPSRSPRSTPLSLHHYCRVCGGKKPPPKSGHRNGEWWETVTCGEPGCRSIAVFLPWKRRATGGYRKPRKFVMDVEVEIDPETQQYVEQAMFDEVLERDFEGFDDERISDVSDEAKSFTWSPVSTILVAFRPSPGRPSEVGLELDSPAAQAFMERFCGGSRDALDVFDLIYAWRCGCPQQTTFELAFVDDFPDVPGFYGACPRCGSVALRVL